jgi:hypothetical protein
MIMVWCLMMIVPGCWLEHDHGAVLDDDHAGVLVRT